MKGFSQKNLSATELKNIWDERERGMEESKEGGKEEGKKEGKPKPLISLEIENCIRNKEAKKSQYFIKDIAHSLNACSVPNTLQNDLISTHFYLITNLSVRWQNQEGGHGAEQEFKPMTSNSKNLLPPHE